MYVFCRIFSCSTLKDLNYTLTTPIVDQNFPVISLIFSKRSLVIPTLLSLSIFMHASSKYLSLSSPACRWHLAFSRFMFSLDVLLVFIYLFLFLACTIHLAFCQPNPALKNGFFLFFFIIFIAHCLDTFSRSNLVRVIYLSIFIFSTFLNLFCHKKFMICPTVCTLYSIGKLHSTSPSSFDLNVVNRISLLPIR